MSTVFGAIRQLLRWLGGAVLLVGALLVIAFGMVQTPLGREWAGSGIARLASDATGYSVTIDRLSGTIPFAMRAARVRFADARGAWLSLHDVAVDLSARRLLAGTAEITRLSAASAEASRLPKPTAAGPPEPLSQRLAVPHLPLRLRIDRLAVDRITLAPPVLGQRIEATLAGEFAIAHGAARGRLDLHRTDGTKGRLALAFALAGTPPSLTLRLTANEPTGVLLDRLLQRHDRPPLTVSLRGSGKLSHWQGRLIAAAGSLARLDAQLALSGERDIALGVTGKAAAAPLLPPDIVRAVGTEIPFAVQAVFHRNGAISLDRVSAAITAGTISGHGSFGGPGNAVMAELRANLPALARLTPPGAEPVAGRAEITARIAGTEERPTLALDASGRGLRLGEAGAAGVSARLTVTPTGDLRGAASRIDIRAQGRIRHLILPMAVPPALGRDVDWALDASAAPGGGTADVTRFTVSGAGIDVTGSGHLDPSGLTGQLRLAVADLRPFAAILGYPVSGALTLAASATQPAGGQVAARLDGSITGLKSGLAPADALLGGTVAIAGAARRDAAGTLILDRLTVKGSGVTLDGAGQYDPATRSLSADLAATVAHLRPLGPSLGLAVAGALSARLHAAGPLDRLALDARLEGSRLAAGRARLDGLRLTVRSADLSQARAVIDGSFRGGGLAGTVALAVQRGGDGTIVIPRLRLAAAGSTIDGNLRIDPVRRRVSGQLDGAIPSLARWSSLAGTKLAGSITVKAGFAARAGEDLDLAATGNRLAWGSGAGQFAIASAAVDARLRDLFGTPSGTARAQLRVARFPAGEIARMDASVIGARPGRFAFAADLHGRWRGKLDLALSGEAALAPRGAGIDLRLARLAGAAAGETIGLERPLILSRHGRDYSVAGLDLRLDTGRISGAGALRGATLSLDLRGNNLALAPAARLVGYPGVSGTVALEARLDGTATAPRGHFALDGHAIRFAAPKGPQISGLGIGVKGDWNGRDLTFDGRVSALDDQALTMTGSLPVVLRTAPLAVTMPPDGRLALHLAGAGRLGNLASLLPLAEDRLTGRFALDLAVGGTLAAPAASGRATIADGRYVNFASGMAASDLQADIVGDRDRLTLRALSATDGSGGTLAASGSILLAGAGGPSADLTATLANFRVAARDEAVARASGNITVTGPIASPKLAARLTVDQADIRLPTSLPPNVTRLNVITIDSKTGQRPAPPKQPAPPALPATLDVAIALPGKIFVRGHGLDSEWRGKLSVTGTSAAPRIAGSLGAIRGNIQFLGKSFQLVRGRIAFGDSGGIDPSLDILAQATAADITAQIRVGGVASAPTVILTSTPVLPPDEILARVLFNGSLSQISVGEGLQVAQAAAALAGGGPDVLDRLRHGLGLDVLSFGTAPTGIATSNLNPAANGTPTTNATAVSGGKYIAPGVFVGASQGLTSQSSQVTVQIEVHPHVTVETDLGQTGGSGIGVNYSFDY